MSTRLALILAAAVALLAAGWSVGYLLQTRPLQARLDGLRAEAAAQAKAAARQALDDAAMKDMTDAHYQAAMGSLRADLDGLRRRTAAVVYVPATPTATGSPDVACFDRAALDDAIRDFAGSAAAIVGEGQAAVTGLDAARIWAATVRKQ